MKYLASLSSLIPDVALVVYIPFGSLEKCDSIRVEGGWFDTVVVHFVLSWRYFFVIFGFKIIEIFVDGAVDFPKLQ